MAQSQAALTLPARIQREEFLERQRRARTACQARGLDGLIVWGRCGGSQDKYADLLYLSNFYSHFPCLKDRPG
ncbi:MAG: hypothetical protein ACREMY_03500, partial [bacterium]